MEKLYKVVFVYPDGHVEEIQELFKAGKDALEYGNSLLNQVRHTEGVINRRPIGDIFDENETIDPYFMIAEIKGKKVRVVYDSNGK